MSSKKLLNRDKRGGKRENAGRKLIWNNKDTITIRVPKFIASQVLELAHRLDSGEEIESDTKSRITVSDFVIQSNTSNNEIITQSDILNQGQDFDCVIDSKFETQSVTNLETTTSNFIHIKLTLCSF
ncbi:MAG: hypothetical protein SAK29_22520 [Scytonema sp. PMC 1069.18]|nr:hypothetical protein [Scytonema sp. PMC 1069.18]MEC4884353.1 hypothetical protein [Scytonema sp. PMC 1070.18]